MLFHDSSNVSDQAELFFPHPARTNAGVPFPSDLSQERNAAGTGVPAKLPFHGEALARDPLLERSGGWIVAGFTGAFALFLIVMNLAGHAPGQSFLLKSISDILQYAGEAIGLFFCIRIILRLRRASTQVERTLRQMEESNTRAVSYDDTCEVQNARRAYTAWLLLSIAIALYSTGQLIWTSYDVRMPSAQVPFPGLYDIGFVGSYPFFLAGTLLLTRRGRAAVGRTRLLLDALAVLGAALALSWFFVLRPAIAGLAQAPSPGAAFLSIYFPTGDLFLVAVGAFLMASPLAHREQQPVFLRLCLGLFFLAITDSLLGYFSLSPSGFNTGTLQDVLWPLSMQFIGLAAIEHPRSVARVQEQEMRASNAISGLSQSLVTGHISQISLTAQAIAPFILALFTCAILLIAVPSMGGPSVLIQADVIALALFLIVVVRQALTLMENNRLTMQMRGELVISRRELQVTRREADEAAREAMEKRALEEGVEVLKETHARVARGDFSARAPAVSGPLLPIAISFNLMVERLSSLAQRASEYQQILREGKVLQNAIEQISQGTVSIPVEQIVSQSRTPLRPAFLAVFYAQRILENQRYRTASALESINAMTRRLQDALVNLRQSHLFDSSSSERITLDGAIRTINMLDQQQKGLLTQFTSRSPQAGTTRASTERFISSESSSGSDEQQEQPQVKTARPSIPPRSELSFSRPASQSLRKTRIEFDPPHAPEQS
ncbi:MAG: methyl-accepting chemotaxis protein [Ktedonobacteraceae bacterium]|nr:methyl-accepting chemotaxis protein [Ktedonobacteraceae bacterium]